ncbi:hypothetical protein KBD33_04620 [Candidatus Gracilibacteria bacterium]|nr:hypothetical protein [Candidatus Gracilibacteria bacterium]
MNNTLPIAIQGVIDALPKDKESATQEIQGFSPRSHETAPGITGFLEELGIKVEGIFSSNGLDIRSDHTDISEFRHMFKNLSVRANQPENSLNINGEKTYYWIDIFRCNLQYLLNNPSE